MNTNHSLFDWVYFWCIYKSMWFACRFCMYTTCREAQPATTGRALLAFCCWSCAPWHSIIVQALWQHFTCDLSSFHCLLSNQKKPRGPILHFTVFISNISFSFSEKILMLASPKRFRHLHTETGSVKGETKREIVCRSWCCLVCLPPSLSPKGSSPS